MKLILLVALGVVFVIKFFATEQSGGSGVTLTEVLTILPFALLQNGLSMLWGYRFGKFNKLGERNSYTVGIEAAVQNTTLAFLVAGTLLHNQDMVITFPYLRAVFILDSHNLHIHNQKNESTRSV